MGMKPKEYDCITMHDLDLKLEGFYDAFKSRRDMDRFMAFSAYTAPYLNRKEVAKLTVQSFLPFDWDEVKTIDFESKKEHYRTLLEQVNGQIRH